MEKKQYRICLIRFRDNRAKFRAKEFMLLLLHALQSVPITSTAHIPENDDSIKIPFKFFARTAAEAEAINNVMCSYVEENFFVKVSWSGTRELHRIENAVSHPLLDKIVVMNRSYQSY